MRNARRSSMGLAFAVAASSACGAQTTVDVARITCEQLTLMRVADPDYIAIWLSGYYSGKRDKTTVDIEQLKENARKVKSYCLYNKGTVMQAVEAVVGAER